MADSSEEAGSPEGNNNNNAPTRTLPPRTTSATSTSNDNNSESLGEIWFETMRRSRGQGADGNSTPSSPTNSSEGQENTSEITGSDSTGSNKGDENEQDNEQVNENVNENNRRRQERETRHHTKARSKKGGYQSDNEGFEFASGTSEDGSGFKDIRSASSYLDAVKLMDLHKKAQELDRKEREQQQRKKQERHAREDVSQEPKKKKQKTEPSKSKDTTEARGKDTFTKVKGSEQAIPSTSGKSKARSNSKEAVSTATTTATSSTDSTKPDNATSAKSKNKQGKAVPGEVQQRLERNAREKQRSGKITDQFQQLKVIITQAGVVVPKGTKGSILAIARDYITNMQQQQKQKELDNQTLKQKIEAIASGSLGPQAAQALKVAAQNNGVTCGVGVAIKTDALSQQQAPAPPPETSTAADVFDPLTVVQDQDYQRILDSCPVGIALATMGGTFLDCNQVFRSLVKCSKTQLRTLSIFHLLESTPPGGPPNTKTNLQVAFEKISSLLETLQSPDNDTTSNNQKGPIVLPGAVQGHPQLALGISLVHSAMVDGNSAEDHHLCVTLIQSHKTNKPTTTNSTALSYPSNTDSSQPSVGFQPAIPPSTLPTKTPKAAPPRPQHALTTILTSTAPIPTTASSSLSSSASSDQNQTDIKQQQPQLQGDQPEQKNPNFTESNQYFTVG